jgi:hypothetical protein
VYFYEIDFLMIFHDFWPLCDFKLVGVFKQTCLVDGKARMGERVREKGGGSGVEGGYVLKGRSWLRMKFEVAFFAGHGILIRVLSPFFLTLPVNELCLLFWPNLNTTSCFVLRIFRMRFPNKIFMLFGPL